MRLSQSRHADAVDDGRAHGLRRLAGNRRVDDHRRAQRVMASLVPFMPRATVLRLVRNLQSPL